MPGNVARVELERGRRLEAIRVRGVRGGVIAPHRSMVGLPWTVRRLFTTLILTAGGLLLLLASLPWVGRLWQFCFEQGRALLGIRAPLGEQTWFLPGGPEFTLPVLAMTTPLPESRTLAVAAVITALGLALSFLLPARWTPLGYFLRLLVAVQASAIGFFAFSPEPFPYRLQDHVFLLLSAGLVVMGLVPLILGLTLHVFDLAFWKKLFLSVAIMGHLAVFVPLQALIHIWLVLHGSAVLMPVLFLVFGLLLDVLVFVSFYGWALSWKGELERRETPPPAHLGRTARGRRG
ncbi:MAG TPA: hypothetical protein VF187_04775 [Gemmatimonadales bacterium]